MASVPSFKGENRALQEMVREYELVRAHNMKFKNDDDHSTVLMFAEGALLCMVCEHFVRMVVEKNFPGQSEGKQLRGLLEFTMAKDRQLFSLPFATPGEGRDAVCNHRNAILHGNFAQAARQLGCASIEEYFKTRYASELEAMRKVVDVMFQQISIETGQALASIGEGSGA